MSAGGVEFSSVPTKEQKPMEGFSDAGIGGSLVCIVVANVLFALGISRLVDCWRHARDEGLDTAHGIQGLARRFAGPRCDVLVRFCVAAMQCGDCVTYFIFVAENAGDLLGSRAPSLAILIAAMAVFEAPLSLTTKLQKLHFLNALGNALVAFALVAPIVVPVCDATASKHRGRMTALTVATVASVAAAYACFGIVCYLAFGDEVNVIASQSLPSTPWPGGAVRGVYVVVVLLTFPLQLFPVTDMFDAPVGRPRAAASPVGLFFLAALAVAFEHKLDHVVSCSAPSPARPSGSSSGPGCTCPSARRDRALDWLSIAA
ncbi:amino acid transmembrane transporter [Aureococcus anophagefferens]|nr:amino acid transmembrane transporter [Aureococcus anophagefferens]